MDTMGKELIANSSVARIVADNHSSMVLNGVG